MRSKLKWIIGFLLLIGGLGTLIYPFASSYYNERQTAQLLNVDAKIVSKLAAKDLSAEKQKAIEYDDNLIGQPLHDPFAKGSGFVIPDHYMDVLRVGETMASIEIPSIGQNLPIYHGTEESTLQKGIGHIMGTSTPYGGKGRHCFLAGHRGIPEALLFTDVNLLKAGDAIYIKVLGETHGYRVTGSEVIEPDQPILMERDMEQDLLTLVTCTPYGVNSHRLLVHATRDDSLIRKATFHKQQSIRKSFGMKQIYRGIAIGSCILFLSALIGTIQTAKYKKEEHRWECRKIIKIDD